MNWQKLDEVELPKLGGDPYLQKVSAVESNHNPNARAQGSSATGQYQMTRGTFEGLRNQDSALKNVSWDQHNQSPYIQEAAARTLNQQNEQLMRRAGHESTDLNKYLYHFAGPTGAAKLLSADPKLTVAQVLGETVAKANPSLANKSVGQVKDLFARKLTGATPPKNKWEVVGTVPLAEGGTPDKWKVVSEDIPLDRVAATEPPAPPEASSSFASFDSVKRAPPGGRPPARAVLPENFQREIKRTGLGWLQGGVYDPARAVAQVLPSEKTRNWAAQNEKDYLANRQELGGEGFDAARLTGAVFSPVNAVPAFAISKALPLAGNLGSGIAHGVAQGATGAAMQPLEGLTGQESTQDLLAKKGTQAALGAGFGGVLGGIGGRLSATTTPNVNKTVPIENMSRNQAVQGYGDLLGKEASDALSPYQKVGLTGLEQKATSVPVTGYVAERAVKKAETANQRAMINLALEPLGGVKIGVDSSGRTAIGEAKDILTKKYDEILPKLEITDPNTLMSKIAAEVPEIKTLSEQQAQKFLRKLNTGMLDNFRSAGQGGFSLTGKQWKTHWSSAKDDYNRLMSPTASADDFEIGAALKKAWEVSRNSLEPIKGAPADIIDQLKNTDRAYYGFKILRKASEASGAAGGRFSPTQVINSIKRYEGQIPLGDKNKLLNAAELSNKVFGPKYGDSGTAGRSQVAGWLGGGAGIYALSPTVAASALAANAAFLTPYAAQWAAKKAASPIQWAANKAAPLASKVPPRVAGALKKVGPSTAKATKATFSPRSEEYEEEAPIVASPLKMGENQYVNAQNLAGGGYSGPMSDPLASFTKGPLSMLGR